MAEVNIVAILTPAPGKFDRVEELFKGIMGEVEKNEPGCLRYKMHRSVDGADLVLVETYKDQQALNEHRASAYLGELQAKMSQEKLVGKPPVHVLCSSIGGFEK